jgi:hypothetical protein
MNFHRLSPTEWDVERCDVDFHIRLERDEYVVDVFDIGTDDPDDAYLTTHTCDTWEQVEQYCRDYDGVRVV